MKKILAILLAVLAVSSSAQVPSGGGDFKYITLNYEITNTGDYATCAPNETRINDKITTVGSDTTTIALSNTAIPFAKAAVGDIIKATEQVIVAGIITTRVAYRNIVTVTDATEVEVNSAWELPSSGVVFDLIKSNCTLDDLSAGWIKVTPGSVASLSFKMSTLAATGGINFRIEGLYSDIRDTNPVITNLWPGILATDAKCPYSTFDVTGYCNYNVLTSQAITFSTTRDHNPLAIRLVFFIVTTDTGSNALTSTFTESR